MVKFKIVEEIGVIQHVDGMNATVSVPQKSACDGCSLKICEDAEQYMIIEALNPVHARVGQKVRIVMKSSSYLRGSAIVYGIPALALIAGAVLGKEVLGSLVTGFDPDLLSAISGFCFFVASFVAIKLWSGRAAGKTEMKAVIEEVLKNEAKGQGGEDA